MKRMLSIGLLLLCMMAACNNKKQVPEPEVAEPSRSIEGPALDLSTIDSLMWQRPDSALALLLPWFDTYCRDAARHVSTMTEYNRHYANLLLAELLYKNDHEQTNRTELLQAVAYYDSLLLADTRGVSLRPVFRKDASHASANTSQSITFLAARAHYMNGVGYYENDSVVPACREYMKALEVLENHFKGKELMGHKAQFMAYAFSRLTEVYSNLYLHEQAIYFAQKSLTYYQKQDASSWHLARMLSEIGTHYDILKQYDSADCYYQKAIELLNDTTLLIYRDIKSHQTFLRYEISGQTDTALDDFFCLLLEAEDDTEELACCLIIGEMFLHEKQFDSAAVYLERVFNGDSQTDAKKQAAEWLVEICKAQGKNEDVLKYAEFLVPFANQDENNGAMKSQLNESYYSFRKKELERQQKMVVRNTLARTLVISGGLTIIILVTLIVYHRNKKKLRQLENEKPNENDTSSKAWNQYAAFLEEPICQDIVRSLQSENIKRQATPKDYPDLVLSDEQLQRLTLTVNRYYGPFDYHLEQHGVKASPIMVSLCHLFLIGIDEKQAAILLNRDYSSISRYVKKLKTAFETQESLAVYFRNLVLNN